jgi:hypothetical protein
LHYSQIPSLNGCQFSIEYAEPIEPVDVPIPSKSPDAENKYPDPVIVDKLTNEIMQHVRSSDNLALKAALDLSIETDDNPLHAGQPQGAASTLNKQSATVIHHTTQIKQHVHQSPRSPSRDSNSTADTTSSEKENEIEEIEIVPLAM